MLNELLNAVKAYRELVNASSKNDIRGTIKSLKNKDDRT